MAKKDRTRIDYMPGQAAYDALGLASEMYPDLRPQALIDKLVITGLVALQWAHPRLYGTDRDRWRLPEQFRSDRTEAGQPQ
jgi:hypothetical protein